MKNSPEKLNFINLNRYLSVELLSSNGLEQLTLELETRFLEVLNTS